MRIDPAGRLMALCLALLWWLPAGCGFTPEPIKGGTDGGAAQDAFSPAKDSGAGGAGGAGGGGGAGNEGGAGGAGNEGGAGGGGGEGGAGGGGVDSGVLDAEVPTDAGACSDDLGPCDDAGLCPDQAPCDPPDFGPLDSGPADDGPLGGDGAHLDLATGDANPDPRDGGTDGTLHDAAPANRDAGP